MIEHIVEPNRLILAWQAPEAMNIRRRWAVGEITRNENTYHLRYITNDEEFYALNGCSLSELKKLSFPGYPAFKLTEPLHSNGVLEAFLRRLPSRSRVDFAQYRSHFGLDDGLLLSDFALLAITGAKLPSDGFTLVDPFDDHHQQREMILEVVGHRHYCDFGELSDLVNSPIEFQPEPENAYDKNAVQIMVKGKNIGYINRLQTRSFLQWIKDGSVSGKIQRTNGEPTHPRVFIFVRVIPTVDSNNLLVKSAL